MLPGIKASLGAFRNRGLATASGAAAAQAIYNNYSLFMSGLASATNYILPNKTARSTVPSGDSSGRYTDTFERAWPVPAVANNDIAATDINTVVYIGLTYQSTTPVYPSNTQVNNVAVTATNWFANTTNQRRTLSVSYYHYNNSLDTLKFVSATFDGPGSGANEAAGATILVLPGKWVPSQVNKSTSNTFVTMPVTTSDLFLYFGSHEPDSVQVDADLITGTQIGYNSKNWYGGQSVGLGYSATNITANVACSASNIDEEDRVIIAKMSWEAT